MKKVNILVATTLFALHVPQAKFEVDETEKTITGKVDSFTNETDTTPAKTSDFVAPLLDGTSDIESIDAYLEANIATVVGGTIVNVPEATAQQSEETAQA